MKPIIRCSSLDRVLNCTHSIFLPQDPTPTQYTEEGSKEHEWAQDYFRTKHPLCKKEMNANTLLYVNYIEKQMKYHKVVIEEHGEKEYDNFILKGTPDAYWLNGSKLTIIDLKNGFMEVSPLIAQLKGYALLKKNESTKTIEIIIVQAEEIKKISFQVGLLFHLEAMLNWLIKYSKPFKSGSHCQFCPSKFHCIKMRDPLMENSQTYEMIKNESHILKMVKEVKDRALIDHPEWFYKKKWGKGHRIIFKDK